MIKIQKVNEVEDSFFNGRNFGSSIDTVRTVLEEVQKNGDSALKEYGLQFDVSSPKTLKIAEEDLKQRGPGNMFGIEQSGENRYLSEMLAYPDVNADAERIVEECCPDMSYLEMVNNN